MTKQEKIAELLHRGVAEVIGKDELEKKLLGNKKIRVKLGIDPTSPNLHIGRAVVLLKMREFQELGHQIVFIVGDFTGVIGDTSDKESERPMLTREQVRNNLKSYEKQAGLLLDMTKVEVRYNSKWLSKLVYEEICDQANQFSLAEFSARENIKKRLDEGKRVSLRELLYPLMQGYDSVVVEADVELGGTDQRFNMLAGRRLQEYYNQKPQGILMTNLISGTDGRKMSSSWGNTINLLDTSQEMYGKIMSIPDDLLSSYYTHCTRIPMKDIRTLEQSLKKGANPRDAKMRLAKEIVTLYHGAPDAKNAEEQFIAVFQKKEMPDEIPTITLRDGQSILDLLIAAGFVSSKSEARRLIAQGGVAWDDVVITKDTFSPELSSNGNILKKGKRHFVRIVKK